MLHGKRLTLRSITRDDLPHYVDWLNDREVTRHLLRFRPLNMDNETDWYESQRKDPDTFNFAIEITAEKKHIGSISLRLRRRVDQEAELGIVIGDKSEWGKGYCREAIGLILAYGFFTLNLNRIYLRVHEGNIGGIKCYERSGFVLEGTLREAGFSEGKFINHHIMSVLRREFQPNS